MANVSLPRLLGRLLRGTLYAAGPGLRRGAPRRLLQLRRRRVAVTSRRSGRKPRRWRRCGRARERGCAAALRRILGDLSDTPELARDADLLAQASTSATTEDRSCTPGCARCRPPWRPRPGCGTRPTCSASTAGAATSLHWLRTTHPNLLSGTLRL